MKKNFFKLMIFLFAGLVVVSCKKKDEELLENRLQDIVLNFNNSSQTQLLEIPISEKSNNWHVYSPSNATWLTQEIVPGSSSIYIYVDGNTTGESRSSYIVIRSGTNTQRVVVNQDTEGGIDLSQTYVAVRYLASTAEVTVSNYEDLTNLVVTPAEGANWVTLSVENDKITFSAELNELTVAREAVITVTAQRKISGEEVVSYINLYQGRGGMTPYIIDIPDFSESSVYKVMDGTKQVAQIAKEFLRLTGQINAQAIVVYPVENDVVYLNKGYVAQIILQNTDLTDATYIYQTPTGAVHGGTVSFDIASNKISGYVAGTEPNPVTRVYMPGDVGMGSEEIENSKITTVEPQIIIDVRGTERNEYPVVKIGTQYWMGKNLNTVYYNQNKNYATIPTNKSSEADRLAANYSVFGYANGASIETAALINRDRYGLLYSYLTIGGFDTPGGAGLSIEGDNIADNLSPSGWIVPTFDEATKLRDYIGSTTRLRKFINYTSDNSVTGDQFFVDSSRPDDNITLYAAPNGSYRATGGGYTSLGAANGAWFWTRTFNTTGTSVTTVAGKAFHMVGLQSSQPAVRQFSIRSINSTGIQIADH